MTVTTPHSRARALGSGAARAAHGLCACGFRTQRPRLFGCAVFDVGMVPRDQAVLDNAVWLRFVTNVARGQCTTMVFIRGRGKWAFGPADDRFPSIGIHDWRESTFRPFRRLHTNWHTQTGIGLHHPDLPEYGLATTPVCGGTAGHMRRHPSVLRRDDLRQLATLCRKFRRTPRLEESA